LPRSEETENERLLREAGLLEYQQHPDRAQPQPEPPPKPFDPLAGSCPAESWIGAYARTTPRPAEWDVYTTAHAPEIAGDAVAFATLPSGDVIVDEEQGDADLSPLADAVEKHLQPPYRATGRREDGSLWAVAARQIEVRELPMLKGDEAEIIVRNGRPAFFGLDPAGEYAVHAERLDGDFWEIQVGVL
jgi:hypothetical protein